MKGFLARNKVFIITALVTCAIIVGGVLWMGGGSQNKPSKTVSPSVLAPEYSFKTSGFADGEYLPANQSAPVTLVEFGDYQCPACIEYHTLIKGLLSDYSGKINFVFRNYPLPQHPNAPLASYAAEAAGLQDKYWQMHDKIFESTSEWVNSQDAKSIFIKYAQELGLDVDKFTSDVDSDAIKNKVATDKNGGDSLRISATPTFYLNGVNMEAQSYEGFKKAVEVEIGKSN